MNDLKPLIIFDMDGVLTENRSSWRMIHEALGTTNDDSFQAYMRGEIDDEEFMRRDIERWLISEPGFNEKDINDIYSKVKFTKGIEDLFRGLKEIPCHTAIISGGIDHLSRKVQERFGIDSRFSNGVEMKDGILTGEGILEVPLRDKGSVIDTLIESIGVHRPIISVGDSRVDITMFKRSDLSIAFDPEEKAVEDNADIVIKDRDLGKVLDVMMEFISSSTITFYD